MRMWIYRRSESALHISVLYLLAQMIASKESDLNSPEPRGTQEGDPSFEARGRPRPTTWICLGRVVQLGDLLRAAVERTFGSSTSRVERDCGDGLRFSCWKQRARRRLITED
jgi:hypothetical protein